LVEGGIAFAFDRRDRRLLLAVLAVNLFTHPAFGAILTMFPDHRGLPNVPLMEVAIALVEGGLLMLALPERKRWFLLLLSFTMNAASYAVGAAINGTFG